MSGANGTFKIPAENVEWFEKQIAKLSKKSVKLLGEQFAIKPFYFGYELVDEKPDGSARKVFDVLLTAEEPIIAGWEFVATLDHANKEIGTLVRVVPNKEIPAHYHTADSKNCDHCGIARYRRDTFVVRNVETGEFKQVGSTCLKDFLGHDVEKIAKLAELLGIAGEVCRAAGERIVGEDRRFINLEKYLAFVAATIRSHGFIGRKVARESGKTATADIAFAAFNHADEIVTDADRETAAGSVEWAQNISESDREQNDYLHNIYTLAASGVIEPRSIGYAASIVFAYLREQAKNAPKVTTVLDNVQGIVDLLSLAGSRVKGAYIDVRVNDRDLRLKIAKGGQFPGCVYVTEQFKDPATGKAPWLGRILTDGTYQPNRWGTTENTQTAIRAALAALNADPAGVAAAYGKMTGHCCFCTKPLTDPRSLHVGYGEKCASNFSLPYPSVKEFKAIQAAKAAEQEAA